MGRKVLKSAQVDNARSLILCALERQQDVNDTIIQMEAFASDGLLTGEAYANVKSYVRDILVPINKTLCMALKDEIIANKSVLNCCSMFLDAVDFVDEDTLQREIERLEKVNRELRDEWWGYLPAVCEINSLRIAQNNLRILELEKQIEKLDNYDNATKSLHDDAFSQMSMIVGKINSIFSKPLFVNGHYDCLGIDMKWANCFVKRWDDNRTAINSELETFMLPADQREEIDNILNSDASWGDKAEQIRQVYERYLFENIKDTDGENPFLAYAEILKKYDGDKANPEVMKAEARLEIALQESGIDIRSITRSLCDDLLNVTPRDVNMASKILNFIKLVEPNAPADLKNTKLADAIRTQKLRGYSFDFPIWSCKWESNMSVDYLGNYGFGYIGADYWQGVDFDDVIESLSLMRVASPSIMGDNYIAGARLYVEGMVSVSSLRACNPDKTDAEMFCRLGAAGAQVVSDKDVNKFVGNILNGNWGDNVGDSEMIGEGFDDCYRAHGIDKNKVIKEERKLW